MNREMSPLSRRALLLGGLGAAAAALAACAPDTPRAADPTRTPAPRITPTRTATPTPTPTPTVIPPLADAAPYAVLPGEIEPACKQAAVDFVTAVLTTGTVATIAQPLDARLTALGQPLELAAPLLGYLPEGAAATLEVVYPQYGGMTSGRTEASIMLVADHLVRPAGAADGAIERRSTTVDVRLSNRDGRWIVTEVLPAVLPAPVATLTPAALSVLANDRLMLPAAARADITGGTVKDAVLTTLDALSQRWRIHVQVLASGHPINVFATDRVSNHTRGQAVDIWAVDGIPIIDQGNSPWRDLMNAALEIGATEVGGPQFIPAGGRTFTDHVHQDHVHVGFWNA